MDICAQNLFLCLLQLVCVLPSASGATWSEWWSYSGISGPDYWGRINAKWWLCANGKHQSPVNINPKNLLFDPNLKPIRLEYRRKVEALLMNTGRNIKLQIESTAPFHINITAGPLSYKYRVSEIVIHFGPVTDKKGFGSEHTIDGRHFPAEIQIVCYNSDLYANQTQASVSSNGLAVIGLLAQLGEKPNIELDRIAQHLSGVRYKNQKARVRDLSIFNLLPDTEHYVTYDGSLTWPGCHETVTWIIMNKPVYITIDQIEQLQLLMQGEEKSRSLAIKKNNRPIQQLHDRTIRTNINFLNARKGCSMEKQVDYEANLPYLS